MQQIRSVCSTWVDLDWLIGQKDYSNSNCIYQLTFIWYTERRSARTKIQKGANNLLFLNTSIKKLDETATFSHKLKRMIPALNTTSLSPQLCLSILLAGFLSGRHHCWLQGRFLCQRFCSWFCRWLLRSWFLGCRLKSRWFLGCRLISRWLGNGWACGGCNGGRRRRCDGWD